LQKFDLLTSPMMPSEYGCNDVEAINEFVEKWKLDEVSAQCLFDTPDDVRERMMKEFVPRDGTRNVNDLFQSFVKSRINQTGPRRRESNITGGFAKIGMPVEERRAKPPTQSRGRVRATHPGELCHEAIDFVHKHNLDDENQELLSQCPIEIQQRIAIEFAPKDASKDVNLLFNSFCASRLEALPQFVNDRTKDFFAKWDINEESQIKFLKLDAEMRDRVIKEFDPREGTEDMNGLFQSFVKSRVELPVKGRRPTDGRREERRAFVTQEPRRRSRTPPRTRAALPPPRAPRKPEPVTQEDVDAFILKWNLNEISMEALYTIPEDGLGRAMREFGPKDESADIDNLFQKFAKSRVEGYYKDLEREKTAPLPRSREPSRETKRETSRPLTLGVPLGMMSARSFKNKHRLNEECRAMVDSLDKHQLVQTKVISEFQPKDRSRDVNQTFASFWNSRVVAALSETYGLSEDSMQRFIELPDVKKAQVIAEFSPREGVKNMDGLFATFCISRLAGPGGLRKKERDVEEPRERKRARSNEGRRGAAGGSAAGTYSIHEFVRRLGLSADCEDVLLQFDDDTQQNIMGKFRPSKDTKNVDNLFKSFAKSFLVPR